MHKPKHLFRLLLALILVISVLPFTPNVQAEDHSSLIISEYIEGSSYNKALEIYNGTGDEVDLKDYTLVHFNNGASQDPDDGKYVNVLDLEGTLENDEVHVVAHDESDEDILDVADQTGNTYFYSFNGDDAIVLFKDYDADTRQGTVVDSIGKVGEDPGSAWNQNQVSTQNATLVRDQSVTSGDQDLYDSYDPSSEWIALPQDTFTHLGEYTEVQAPEQKDQYTAVVERVVDGDTIKIQDPVLGTTTVRYLNIDTPETYHLDSYDPSLVTQNKDHSQKYHGERATQYLQNLLDSGDEVRLKLGEEAKDDYGRLLAEVIRKDDGVNTNLKMVEQGYAVTYFIYPFESDMTFLTYQQATKEAVEKDYGIWSDSTPLLELPFEFRVREQDKDFSKFVGNYETEEYVKPENWDDVPVYKRVFFWTEEDAIKAGYEPDFERDPLIADARYADEGDTVTVTGTVIAKDEAGSKTNYYIQDQSAGIVVRTDDLDAEIGEDIEATGETNNYYGLLQVLSSDAEVIDHEGEYNTPSLIQSTDIGEDLESQLVMLEDVTIKSEDSYNNYEAKDANGTFTIDSDHELVEVGETYAQLIGYVDYNNGEFKVTPRFEKDVVDEIATSDIEDVRDADLGTLVKVEGIITAMFEAGGKTNYFIQDETAGLVVRAEDINAEIGDQIEAKARTEEYYDLLQLQPSPTNIEITDEDAGVPEPKNIESDDLGEELEGQLVEIDGVRVTDVDSHHNYTAEDDEGTFTIDSDQDLVEIDEEYTTIIGVVDYNYGEYKLTPRFEEDVMARDEDDEDHDEDLDEDIFGEYLDGDESLHDVKDHIIDLYDELSSDELADLLDEELSEFIETNGNTSQHIDSTVHHIMKSLSKLDKGNTDVEERKIQHELEKIIKKHNKSKHKGNGKAKGKGKRK